MKYKPGDEFIITVKSRTTGADEPNYLMDGIFYLCESTLDKLKPLDELKHAEYQRGLADAWEAARKIGCDDGLSLRELIDIFCMDDAGDILKDNTAAEAIAKIRAYEEEKKIKVGDEITDGELKAIALELRDGYIHYLLADGTVSYHYPNVWKKTGRHFSEVAAMLDKLKGDAPDV